jgi:hypothetical protein
MGKKEVNTEHTWLDQFKNPMCFCRKLNKDVKFDCYIQHFEMKLLPKNFQLEKEKRLKRNKFLYSVENRQP